MEFLIVFFIAISLSMDTFSLSLSYGTLGIPKRKIYLLSLVVGIFHFLMPLLGLYIGNKLFNLISIDFNILVFIILTILGIEMTFESSKEEEIKSLSGFEILLFAFSVSIDSFSVGITLNNFTFNKLLILLLFAVVSYLFTYMGLILGTKIRRLIGKFATILGGTLLIIIGISFLF